MNRTLTKLKLPVSGYEVEIIPYFTRGERLDIERALMSKSKLSMVDGKQELQFDPMVSIEQREKTVALAVKTIDGKPFTLELMNDLPEEDGAFIESAINDIGKDKKKPVTTSTK